MLSTRTSISTVNTTHLRQHPRTSWTRDRRRRTTPLQRESWQTSRQTAWGCGWSLQPRSPKRRREADSVAAGWDPVRSDPREAWWRWRWGPTRWNSPAGTSSSGLCPLCSWCSPSSRPAWTHTRHKAVALTPADRRIQPPIHPSPWWYMNKVKGRGRCGIIAT